MSNTFIRRKKKETLSEDENESITPSALSDPDFVSNKVNKQLEKSRDHGNIIIETLECSPVKEKKKS